MKHGERISTHDIDPIIRQHLDKCSISYDIQNNCMTVTVENKGTEDLILGDIQTEIERAIPEIGKMIDSGLVEPIRITIKNLKEE